MLNRDCVRLNLTRLGGQMAPVYFRADKRVIQPYAIAPWAKEKNTGKLPGILQALRGDFFCLPFGGNSTPYKNERHPPHGESCNRNWSRFKLEENERESVLSAKLECKAREGRITKKLLIRDGHSAVYSTHLVEGFAGPVTMGHHPVLAFPDRPGAARISLSEFEFGMTVDRDFEQPENLGYTCLKPGVIFERIEEVPDRFGKTADLSRYPARRGYEDLVQMNSRKDTGFAWTAAVFEREGYAWFSLKNPKLLPSTLFWMSNGGRHYPPWNSRHINVCGLEEVCSYFDTGLAESVKSNPLSKRGVKTCLRLNGKKTFVLPFIQGVCAIPDGFDRVERIEAEDENLISLIAESGKHLTIKIDHQYLFRKHEA